MNRQQQIDHFVALAHQLAMQRLRQRPERLAQVQGQLARWRDQAGPTASDRYWNQWETLLNGPLDELEQAICADTEQATVLRSVSPMSCLITQAERAQLLRQVREGA